MSTKLGLRAAFREEVERAELVALLLREELGADVRPSAITVQPRNSILPLSHGQERLWLLEQIGGLGSAYNLPAAVRLRGNLDMAALGRSVATVVDRDEGLRARFSGAGGVAAPVVDPPGAGGVQGEGFR